MGRRGDGRGSQAHRPIIFVSLLGDIESLIQILVRLNDLSIEISGQRCYVHEVQRPLEEFPRARRYGPSFLLAISIT